MKEAPPVKVSPEGVEIEPRRTGHRYADWIVAGAAILISLVSLGVAVKHGLIMERLVAANSWPLMQYSTGNADDQDRPIINMSVDNAGVGPAIVKHFTLIYKGKRYAFANDFLVACCTEDGKLPAGTATTTEFVEGSVIKSGQTVNYLRFGLTEQSRPVWDRLNQERFKITFDACYCSVFGECWRSDLTSVDPQRVNVCPPPTGGSRPR